MTEQVSSDDGGFVENQTNLTLYEPASAEDAFNLRLRLAQLRADNDSIYHELQQAHHNLKIKNLDYEILQTAYNNLQAQRLTTEDKIQPVSPRKDEKLKAQVLIYKKDLEITRKNYDNKINLFQRRLEHAERRQASQEAIADSAKSEIQELKYQLELSKSSETIKKLQDQIKAFEQEKENFLKQQETVTVRTTQAIKTLKQRCDKLSEENLAMKKAQRSSIEAATIQANTSITVQSKNALKEKAKKMATAKKSPKKQPLKTVATSIRSRSLSTTRAQNFLTVATNHRLQKIKTAVSSVEPTESSSKTSQADLWKLPTEHISTQYSVPKVDRYVGSNYAITSRVFGDSEKITEIDTKSTGQRTPIWARLPVKRFDI